MLANAGLHAGATWLTGLDAPFFDKMIEIVNFYIDTAAGFAEHRWRYNAS